MVKLTDNQRLRINFVLESIFTRPELLNYMREQLIENFWKEIEEWESNND